MPQAQLLVSIAGGGWQSGGISNVAAGAAIAIQIASSAGVSAYQWEIYDYPPAFALPAGWTNINGVYTSMATVPPGFALAGPIGTNTWGKYGLRLRINGNPLEYQQDGSRNPAYNPDYEDTSTILSVASPNAGMPGLCFGESTQYDTFRSYVGQLMACLRFIDSKL